MAVTTARKTIYLEHFGMMGSEEYVNNSFIPKMKKYEKAGLIFGVDWIATFESALNPFDQEAFETTIINHLM